jgi:glycosyltransferase involved in cell wall biosynthesis
MSHKTHDCMVACVGDANDPSTFGGLPFHFLRAGQSGGLVKEGYSFRISCATKLRRYLWNCSQLAHSGNFGGYQYSEDFLRKLWASDPRTYRGGSIINLFQLFPCRIMETQWPKYFYLDQTLLDLFDYYGAGASLSDSWRQDVLERERAQYHAAEKVIFRSKWAGDRAKHIYGLPDEKIAVVLPGANIEGSSLEEFDNDPRFSSLGSSGIKLIFVGKEWKRKGLDRILGAMHIAQAQGASISLTVIGVKPETVPSELVKGLTVDWLGFFDKSASGLKFARLLARHDAGVLLSRSEAGGVSLREFGRVGLPVIASDTGGCPEFAMSDAALFFAPEAPNDVLADALVNYAADREGLDALKQKAWERRQAFDWSVAVKRFSSVL